jgi:hypothetical protein
LENIIGLGLVGSTGKISNCWEKMKIVHISDQIPHIGSAIEIRDVSINPDSKERPANHGGGQRRYKTSSEGVE